MHEFDHREAAYRQADRLMASGSRKRPTQRPGAEVGDPMTVIEIEGAFFSFGPADIQAVLDEMTAGAACGICRRMVCRQREARTHG